MVLCIGDIHLQHGHRRNATRLEALEQIARHALWLSQHGALDLIACAGDVFHGESSIEDRNEFAAFVRRLALCAPVIIVRGNHDRLGDLDLFGQLNTAFAVHVVTQPAVLEVPRRNRAPLTVGCLPYPTKAGLISASVPASEMASAVHLALGSIFAELGAQMLDAIATRGAAPLFLGHVTLGGAELSVGQPLIGEDLQIDPTHLAKLPPATAVVLNHIHKPQTLHGAVYVGSVSPVDWGEAESKRFLVLGQQSDGAWEITSVPLDIPRMFHVDGVFDGTTFEWVVKRGPDGPVETPPASWRGCEVRVRYRFNAGDVGRLDAVKARILADFAEASHLELEPVAVSDRAVRAPEVVQATTLADKVEAWCAVSGYQASSSVLEKLAQLEGGADLLRALEARLAESAVSA